MFRLIVAAKVRTAWRHLNAGDYEYVLDQFAEPFSHRFVGEHALGGTRRTRKSQAAWFERLGRLFPGIEFEVRDVLVRGWPWRTRAAVLLGLQAQVAGEAYENEIAQTLEIRWGRISAVNVLEDSHKLARALDRLAAAGVEEAAAAPIAD